MGKKYNSKLKKYVYTVTPEEQLIHQQALEAQSKLDLADPAPATVSLKHFIERGMSAQVAAGQCIVTMPDPISGPGNPAILVDDVKISETARKCYDIVTSTGKVWSLMSATLTVVWLNAAGTPKVEYDIDNIFKVIAAVAADNLMTTEMTAPDADGASQVYISDGMGNALTLGRQCEGRFEMSLIAGQWFGQYRYGEHLVVHNGSGGTGKTDPIGRFEKRMSNARY